MPIYIIPFRHNTIAFNEMSKKCCSGDLGGECGCVESLRRSPWVGDHTLKADDAASASKVVVVKDDGSEISDVAVWQ